MHRLWITHSLCHDIARDVLIIVCDSFALAISAILIALDFNLRHLLVLAT